MLSDEESDDDSSDHIDMFDDFSDVEDEDNEHFSRGEDCSLLAPHVWQCGYCTSLDTFDPRASTLLIVALHTYIFVMLLAMSTQQ